MTRTMIRIEIHPAFSRLRNRSVKRPALERGLSINFMGRDHDWRITSKKRHTLKLGNRPWKTMGESNFGSGTSTLESTYGKCAAQTTLTEMPQSL